MRPSSITTMRSARSIVVRRCAITSVVRPASELRQRGLHQVLGFGVERGGRLVEDQDRRVLQDRARDGDALALPAGEQRAALADHGVEALRQVRRRTRARARPAPRARRRPRSRAGALKAMLLRIESSISITSWLTSASWLRRSAQAVLADVDAVEQHRAAVRVVEARQQADERRLAAARAADDRDGLARRDLDADAAAAPGPCRRRRRTSRRGTRSRRGRASSATSPPRSSAAASSTSKTLSPAAMPCCSGPTTLTRRRSGAVTSSSAVRKDVNSPIVQPALEHVADRHVHDRGEARSRRSSARPGWRRP